MCAGIDQSLYMILEACCRCEEERGVACPVSKMDRGPLREKVAEDIDVAARRCEVL